MVKITPALLLASSLIALTGCNDGGGSSSDSGTTTPPPPQAETWTQEVNGETLTFEEGSYVVLNSVEACDLLHMTEFDYNSEFYNQKRAYPGKVEISGGGHQISGIIVGDTPENRKK